MWECICDYAFKRDLHLLEIVSDIFRWNEMIHGISLEITRGTWWWEHRWNEIGYEKITVKGGWWVCEIIIPFTLLLYVLNNFNNKKFPLIEIKQPTDPNLWWWLSDNFSYTEWSWTRYRWHWVLFIHRFYSDGVTKQHSNFLRKLQLF